MSCDCYKNSIVCVLASHAHKLAGRMQAGSICNEDIRDFKLYMIYSVILSENCNCLTSTQIEAIETVLNNYTVKND